MNENLDGCTAANVSLVSVLHVNRTLCVWHIQKELQKKMREKKWNEKLDAEKCCSLLSHSDVEIDIYSF